MEGRIKNYVRSALAGILVATGLVGCATENSGGQANNEEPIYNRGVTFSDLMGAMGRQDPAGKAMTAFIRAGEDQQLAQIRAEEMRRAIKKEADRVIQAQRGERIIREIIEKQKYASKNAERQDNFGVIICNYNSLDRLNVDNLSRTDEIKKLSKSKPITICIRNHNREDKITELKIVGPSGSTIDYHKFTAESSSKYTYSTGMDDAPGKFLNWALTTHGNGFYKIYLKYDNQEKMYEFKVED